MYVLHIICKLVFVRSSETVTLQIRETTEDYINHKNIWLLILDIKFSDIIFRTKNLNVGQISTTFRTNL